MITLAYVTFSPWQMLAVGAGLGAGAGWLARCAVQPLTGIVSVVRAYRKLLGDVVRLLETGRLTEQGGQRLQLGPRAQVPGRVPLGQLEHTRRDEQPHGVRAGESQRNLRGRARVRS